MQLNLLALFFLLSFSAASPPAAHKYFVSHTSLHFNPLSQHFEVTVRLFTHDLEWAISRDKSVRLDLGGNQEPAFAEGLVRDYLRFHLNISLNDSPVAMSYVGKEVEHDRIFCYLEFPASQSFHAMTIENTLLTDVFDEQKNYLELEMAGWKQSLVFTTTHPRQVIFR